MGTTLTLDKFDYKSHDKTETQSMLLHKKIMAELAAAFYELEALRMSEKRALVRARVNYAKKNS